MPIKRIEIGPRYAQAVVANGFVFLSGQVASDPSVSVADQTQQIFTTIDGLLSRTGTDKRQLVSVTIYIADMGDFAVVNAVWERWIDCEAKPTRATVQVALASPAYRIEIQAVAALK